MNLTGNTVLITGGSAGIGLALAGALAGRGNTVIITGRSEAKLAEAKAANPALHTRACDVGNEAALRGLAAELTVSFPDLNVLVNNAGVMSNWRVEQGIDGLLGLDAEVATNFTGPVRLTALLLAHLRARPSAAVINVTSGVVYGAMPDASIYGATKAALHAFTCGLRMQLHGSNVKVMELMPPTVETAMSTGRFEKQRSGLMGVDVMTTDQFVTQALRGLERGDDEIRVGQAGLMYWARRFTPGILDGQLRKLTSVRPG